jgi:16S rRNA (uracil1498-N3)-methyltransferase
MRVIRIHVPGPLTADSDLTLPAQAGEHLTRVLRLEAGAPFVLFDGNGGEYTATLGARSGKSIRARVLEHRPVERESPLDVTLLQGIARGERMDLIVKKATELGVTRIMPVFTERSVVRVDPRQRDRKHEHWQAIAISACEQCGRNRVPQIAAPAGLEATLRTLPAGGMRFVLAADGRETVVSLAARARGAALVLLIGPEGGLADAEQQLALAQGFVACRLGPRILRTETAGLAALATLQSIAGDFSG